MNKNNTFYYCQEIDSLLTIFKLEDINKIYDSIPKLDINDQSDINTLLSKLNDCFKINEHGLFMCLNNSNIVPKTLGEIMAPFYFAVFNWVDHLEKLHLKLKSDVRICSPKIYYDAMELVGENIMDEKGYDNDIKSMEKCHVTTFVNFLHAIGFHSELCETNAVKHFNKTLSIVLANEPFAFNACVLAGIEYFYICISNIISTYCDKNNIKQAHYKNHELIDLKHSMDFFRVAAIHSATKKDMVYGVTLGYKLLWDVFHELWNEHRKKC